MADEHDGPIELVDDRSEIRRIARDSAKRHRRRENGVLVALQELEHGAPTRSVSEGAVNEKDCWFGHEASFRVESNEQLGVAVCARPSGIAPVVALVRSPVLTMTHVALHAVAGRPGGRRVSTRASTGATNRATRECDAPPIAPRRGHERTRAQQTDGHRRAVP